MICLAVVALQPNGSHRDDPPNGPNQT